MISLLLIIAAAIFKSVADTLQHHFLGSRFKNLNEKWWNPAVSWMFVKFLPLTHYRLDAWHLFNSLMIVSFISAVVFYEPVSLQWYWQLLIGGTAFNIVFELLYSKVWQSK